ncbi:hypothetical protein BC829DRAFT_399869 [Chytridium lagenaria]|nr:hypothetical protein BC829DRAFT_399869 [Chytridium lagenaria]
MSADWTLIFPAVTGLALTLQGAASGHLTAALGRGISGVWTVSTSCVIGLIVWLVMSNGRGDGSDFGAARLGKSR